MDAQAIVEERLPAIPMPPETAPIRMRLWWAVRTLARRSLRALYTVASWLRS